MKENEYEYKRKYRNAFCNLIMDLVDFRTLDEQINSYGVNVPELLLGDSEEWMESSLGSKYVFLRNDIDLSKLTESELNYLKECEKIDNQFLLNTFKRVMFKDGDYFYYGTPIDPNLKSSKSLVFNFCCIDIKLTTEEYKKVQEIYNYISKYLMEILSQKIDCSIEFIYFNQFSIRNRGMLF